MEDRNRGTTPGEIKRASLLGLPAELRLPIYREVFRIKSWEAHQARTRDFSAPKRRLSDQCPICQCVSRDKVYLYPTCRLAIDDDGELLLYGQCYTLAGLHERRNRGAILRVSRSISIEALHYLYANTPFMVFLGKNNRPGDPSRSIGRLGVPVRPNETAQRTGMPLSKVQNLYLRVDSRNPSRDDTLAAHLSETMSAVWRDRGQAKIQLQRRSYHNDVIQEMLLTTVVKSTSRQQLRVIFYGLAVFGEGGQDFWCLFVLQNALPQYLVAEVTLFITPEDYVDGAFWMDILLPAIEKAQDQLEL